MKPITQNASWVMLLMFIIAGITPFTNDIFLASMPSMSHYFHVSNIQMMMTVFMASFAISQLFYGPLSDRFGRKPIFLGGLIIYIIGCLMTAFANEFTELLWGRVVQAVGVASAIISVLSIIRDSYAKADIGKKVAIVMGIIGVCPMLSPIIGSFIQAYFQWRGNMFLLLLMGMIALITVALFFKESMVEKNLHALKIKNTFNNYFIILKHKQFQGYAFAGAFGYSALFCYLAAAPMIIITLFGKSISEFALLCAINATGLIITAIIAPKLSRIKSLATTLYFSAGLITLGGLSLLILSLIFKLELWMITVPMFVMTLGVGLMRPTASTGALQSFPAIIAGSASAMYSFISFGVSALFIGVVHFILQDNLAVFAAMITVFGLFAGLSALRSEEEKILETTGLHLASCYKK